MRRAALALVAGLYALPAMSQVRTPEFTYAETLFNEGYDLKTRVIAQVLFITTGHQNSVPTERFSLRTYGALKRFQEENNLRPDGVISKVAQDRLFAVAAPMLQMWDFQLTPHPWRGRPIWMPREWA